MVRDFTFSHVGSSEGVCSQRIFSILQTADGALWWSGKDDVERYNGLSIRHYQIGKPDVLSHQAGHITKLTLSADSILAAFDNKGCIFLYDEVQDKFQLLVDVSEMMEGDVMLNDVVMTDQGMWLAMREGVYYLQDQTLIPVVKGIYVNTFVNTRFGLLICTREGVFHDPAHPAAVPKRDMKLKKLLNYNVESGYYDVQHNKVWLGGFLNGLHILTITEKGTFTENELTGDAIYNPVRSICPYDDHTMLVGIDGLGVFRVTRQPEEQGAYRGELLFDANEGAHGVLHGNGIYALVCDCWGNIIIGSYSGGIDIARPVGSTSAVFQHVRDNQQSLLNDHVNCVAQWPDGWMAMGTDNGVSLHDPVTQQWRHTCHGAVVLSLCLTPRGTMLASTYGKGVYEITESGQAHLLYTQRDGVLRDDHVYRLLYDRQGDLWMGCLDGDLVQLSAQGCHYYPINNVQDIVQLPDDRIAVGTANGIWVVDGRTHRFSELDYQHSLPSAGDVNKYIYSLFVNNSQQLWIGTDGGGVYVYDLVTKACRQLTQHEGLSSNMVYSICKDGKGRMFIATDRGLSFCQATQGEGQTEVVDVNYCYGLAREYSARAVINLQNGHILYGTTSGALIINPDNIQRINYTARLNILGISCSEDDSELFKKRVHGMLKEGKLRLHYSERTFDLYFESINLRNQFDIAWQYRVGHGEWSQPSDQPYIRFTNLEPGTHQLTLRSVSRTCGAVLDEQHLTIIVADPWWDSWWMWTVYISLIILAFYGAWRFYQLHTKYMRLVVNSTNLSVSHEEKPSSVEEDLAPCPSPLAPRPSPPAVIEQTPQEDEGSDFMEKVTKLIIDNLSDPDFTIDRLCREMAMSRTLFYLKLKTYTGKSPQDFIRIIRLERAAALLRSGRSVTDTAYQTGFDNSKYFSTVFKKYFGVSPSKYC